MADAPRSSTIVPAPAFIEGTRVGDGAATRTGLSILSASAFTVAACLMTGLVPANWVVPSMVGSILLLAWCAGAATFICSIGPDELPVRLAMAHQRKRSGERRLRNAA